MARGGSAQGMSELEGRRRAEVIAETRGAKKVPPLAASASPSHRSCHTAELPYYTRHSFLGKRNHDDFSQKKQFMTNSPNMIQRTDF
jgi:hypothetical protein